MPKNIFPVKNSKTEHHYGVLHIWISPNFSLNSIKEYFQSKTKQAVQELQAFVYCAVDVNSTVASEHFESLKTLIILNIWKEKLVLSCPLGSFYLKII